MTKIRLDLLLVNKGLAPSRNKAQAFILEGIVYVNGEKYEKAGTMFEENTPVEIRNQKNQWVSRGAYKLLKALREFRIEPSGKVCLDVGASTGGFSHVLLKNGAKKIYAVDVGYGQLAWKVRNDPRVIVMERTNARYLCPDLISDSIELVTIDVSFISLKKILPVISELLSSDGKVTCLVKPQFEAGRSRVGKKGVVKDPLIHRSILVDLFNFVEEKTNLRGTNISYSPVKGPKGNIEYLLLLEKKVMTKKENAISMVDIDRAVKEAHTDI